MALKFPIKGGGGDFKSVPSGSHVAVCSMVVDMGLQPGSAQYPDPKRKIYVRFEIPAERVKYEKDGQKYDLPAVIGTQFTASMHEKATLRKQLEGWRGRKFTDDEASNFDVASILGKGCMISVVENVVGDKVYSNIASMSLLPRGVEAPKSAGDPIYFDGDDQAQWKNLPEWLQEKITNQVKPKASSATGVYADSQAYDFSDQPKRGDAYEGQGITDDDIPF